MYSKQWRTFHDFLHAYIRDKFGGDWGKAEMAKPSAEQHPLMQWYLRIGEQAKQAQDDGTGILAGKSGEMSAFYSLGYDLYCLDHNAELQAKLIGRLRLIDQFWGARHEVFVAAALIRAGFMVAFEDEDDRETTHCEFTATHSHTGRRFSVEAKHRAGNHFRIGRQLHRALKKQADHERIVFIELNDPAAVPNTSDQIPQALSLAADHVDSFARQQEKLPEPLSPAFVFICNNVSHYANGDGSVGRLAMMMGFRMPDLTPVPRTLREIVDIRERHREVFEIGDSIRDHSEIPATFDGEHPEYVFGRGARRFVVGNVIKSTDAAGRERDARIETGTVSVEERKAVIAGRFVDSDEVFVQEVPLTDDELSVYERHPETFFGVPDGNGRQTNTPYDRYKFFFDGYKEAPKERLIDLMSDAPDIDELRRLDQPQLAKEYALRVTEATLMRDQAAVAARGDMWPQPARRRSCPSDVR